MGASNTIQVDDLIDRQQLTGRTWFMLILLLFALLCDGFDLQLLAFAAPRLAKEWGIEPQALRYVISANLLGMTVQATEQYPRGLGPTVPELAARLPQRPDKTAFSCCAVTLIQ